MSLRLYAGDHQGKLPCDFEETTLGSFALLTNKYQTSYKTWICPSDPGVMAGSSRTPWTSSNLSYAYGGFGLTESGQPDTPLVCDRTSGTITAASPYTGNSLTHKSDGGNVLFADGHVAFQNGFNPPMYRAQNP